MFRFQMWKNGSTRHILIGRITIMFVIDKESIGVGVGRYKRPQSDLLSSYWRTRWLFYVPGHGRKSLQRIGW